MNQRLPIGAIQFIICACASQAFAGGAPAFTAVRLQMQDYVFGAQFGGIDQAGNVFGLTVQEWPGPDGNNRWATRFTPEGTIAWDYKANQDRFGRGFSGVGATNDGVFYGEFGVVQPPSPTPMLYGQYAATVTESDGLVTRDLPDAGTVTYVIGASPNGQWIAGNQIYGENESSGGILFGPNHSMFATGSFIPQGVNDAGVVVGFDAQSQGPATWTIDGGVQLMPRLPLDHYERAVARLVNETGTIEVHVETSPDDPNFSKEFLFDGEKYTELEQPGEASWISQVNDNGWVTGWVFPPGQIDSPLRIPSLWIDGKRYDVNDLFTGHDDIHLETAEALNNRGQLVAVGYEFPNLAVAYLLTPIVPEPTAIAVIFASIPLSRRRR